MQDGKASIPLFYRRWITRRYGHEVIEALDMLGGMHDREVKYLDFSIANHLFYWRMRKARLPFLAIRLPIRLTTSLYALLPRPLRALYWKLFTT